MCLSWDIYYVSRYAVLDPCTMPTHGYALIPLGSEEESTLMPKN